MARNNPTLRFISGTIVASEGPDRQARVAECLESWPDGRIKLLVVAAGLRLRRNRPALSLHVPEPDARPGDEVDFSAIPIPAAGSVPRRSRRRCNRS